MSRLITSQVVPVLPLWDRSNLNLSIVYSVASFGYRKVPSLLKGQRHSPDSLRKNQTYLSLFRRGFVIGSMKQGTGKCCMVSSDVTKVQHNVFGLGFSHLRFNPIFIFWKEIQPICICLSSCVGFYGKNQEVAFANITKA
jgi:hypothetical protein